MRHFLRHSDTAAVGSFCAVASIAQALPSLAQISQSLRHCFLPQAPSPSVPSVQLSDNFSSAQALFPPIGIITVGSSHRRFFLWRQFLRHSVISPPPTSFFPDDAGFFALLRRNFQCRASSDLLFFATGLLFSATSFLFFHPAPIRLLVLLFSKFRSEAVCFCLQWKEKWL